MDQEFTSIQNIALQIFSKNAQKENSIQLQLDGENNEIIFEQLILLFTEGMKILFGNNGNVNIATLSDNDFQLVNYYFKSFGFTVKYKILNNETNINEFITTSNKDNLSDYFLKLKSNIGTFIISFDYYINNTSCSTQELNSFNQQHII